MNAGIIPAALAVAPYASSYNAHTVNHAVAAPVVSSAAYVAAPAAYAASPYIASPYYASPYSYAGLPATYVL